MKWWKKLVSGVYVVKKRKIILIVSKKILYDFFYRNYKWQFCAKNSIFIESGQQNKILQLIVIRKIVYQFYWSIKFSLIFNIIILRSYGNKITTLKKLFI